MPVIATIHLRPMEEESKGQLQVQQALLLPEGLEESEEVPVDSLLAGLLIGNESSEEKFGIQEGFIFFCPKTLSSEKIRLSQGKISPAARLLLETYGTHDRRAGAPSER
jgi:hypothetical protein